MPFDESLSLISFFYLYEFSTFHRRVCRSIIMPPCLFLLDSLCYPISYLCASWVLWKSQGVQCKRVARSINSVGLYVPGGTAVLPSTALMLSVVSWINISLAVMIVQHSIVFILNIDIYLSRFSWQLIILYSSLHKLLDVKLLFLQLLQLRMALHARYLSILYEKYSYEVFLVLTNVFLQEVLYCAKKAGVTHILKAGGAQVWSMIIKPFSGSIIWTYHPRF